MLRPISVTGAVLAILSTSPATAQVTSRSSVDSAGLEGDSTSELSSISADLRVVVFISASSNLDASDTNGLLDVFVHDRNTGVTAAVSITPSGKTGNNNSGGISFPPSISFDGRFVAFSSDAGNLVSGMKTHGTQVFVRDRLLGTSTCVSVDSSGNEGDNTSEAPALSFDGIFVAFDSYVSNLVANDTNGKADVFVRNLATGVTELISIGINSAPGNDDSLSPFLSADGSVVAFSSRASNLVAIDSNSVLDAFVFDRSALVMTRVSMGPGGVEGNGISAATSLSADGNAVCMHTLASNLVAVDTNGVMDCVVFDRSLQVCELISVDSSNNQGNSVSSLGSISANGAFVAFQSHASNLVSGDTNGTLDIFLRDRFSGSTTRLSVDSAGVEATSGAYAPSVSADGQTTTFSSGSSNLVGSDANGMIDVFVRDMHIASWKNYGSGLSGTNGIPSLVSLTNPIIGSTITVDLSNSSGQPTVGLLIVGFSEASIPTHFGADLQVLPSFVIPISFSYGSNSYIGILPSGTEWSGFVVDLQGVELDAGAPAGVSFSQGLELILGV